MWVSLERKLGLSWCFLFSHHYYYNQSGLCHSSGISDLCLVAQWRALHERVIESYAWSFTNICFFLLFFFGPAIGSPLSSIKRLITCPAPDKPFTSSIDNICLIKYLAHRFMFLVFILFSSFFIYIFTKCLAANVNNISFKLPQRRTPFPHLEIRRRIRWTRSTVNFKLVVWFDGWVLGWWKIITLALLNWTILRYWTAGQWKSNPTAPGKPTRAWFVNCRSLGTGKLHDCRGNP
jgi:hypothetical protein